MSERVILVIGSGASNIPEIAAAENAPENWRLAEERGDVEVGYQPSGEEWCVVLPGDLDETVLRADPAVGVVCGVPGDSPALARWRAS